VVALATLALAATAGFALGAFRDRTTMGASATAAASFPLTVQRVPHIGNTAFGGNTLSAVPGRWSGLAPTAPRTYQWYRCTGGACVASGSETSSTSFAVPAGTDGPIGADSNRTFVVRETVTSGGTTAAAFSVPTRPQRRGGVLGVFLLGGSVDVLAVSTVATTMPEIGTAPRRSVAVSVSAGTWRDEQLGLLGALTSTRPLAGDPTFGYAWLRCGPAGSTTPATLSPVAGCTAIPGATDASYTPTSDDVGRRLRVAVTRTSGEPVLAVSLAVLGLSSAVNQRAVAPVVTQASDVVLP
jgi:hypothetical protein